MKAGKHEIPRRPLLWLTAALVFTVPPIFRSLAPWVPVCFMALLGVKFWMERSGWRLRSPVWKVVCLAVVIASVKLTYHALFGLESGLSLFLLLVSVKMIEAHTARDFHILALVGWILCLAGLFISQDLSSGLYATAAFTLILAAVVQFHRGSAKTRPFSGPLLASLGLVLRSIPLVIALFFLFPRGSPVHFDFKPSFANRTGMSNDLKPGSIASLALSNEVAFRADFPDGNMPELSNLYWRASVLTQDHGLAWNASAMDDVPRAPGRPGTDPVRQRIILQPHDGFWIFALEWPADAPRGTRMYWGDVLRSRKGIFNQWQYEVTSYSTHGETELSPEERAICLQLPGGLSPEFWDLVRPWRRRSTDPRAVVAAALEYFRKQQFLYTLTPGLYDANTGLDDFLFHRRSGFCEHYAAAFATLMRAAGIPSRVVIGYHGGQFNGIGKYLVVHQSDAHAWCEVWLPGIGWQRADPTASISGGRVGEGFADMRDSASVRAALEAGKAAGIWENEAFLRNIRQAWEAVSYEWDSRVTSYDEEAQQSFFLDLGWVDTGPLRLLAWLLAAAAALMGAQALWTWWRTRLARDPLKVLYDRFCRRIAALGVKREPWEGPLRFAERAAASLPEHAGRIRDVAGAYVLLRYSAGPGAREMAREMKTFRRLVRI